MDFGGSQLGAGWYLCIWDPNSLHHETLPENMKSDLNLSPLQQVMQLSVHFLERNLWVKWWMWVSRFLFMLGYLFISPCMQSGFWTFTFICCSLHFIAYLNLSLHWCSLSLIFQQLFSPCTSFGIAELFFFPILMWLYFILNDLFSMSFLSKDWIWEILEIYCVCRKTKLFFQKFI